MAFFPASYDRQKLDPADVYKRIAAHSSCFSSGDEAVSYWEMVLQHRNDKAFIWNTTSYAISPIPPVNSPQPKPKEKTMNTKANHMMCLLQKDYITVAATYNETASPLSSYSKAYTFKATASMNLAVGDTCVVEAPNGEFKLVTITAIHETPQIDLEADFAYKWLVQKVDTTGYEANKKREQEFTDTLVALEKEKQRQQVLEDMQQHLPQALKDKLAGAVAALNNQIATSESKRAEDVAN